MKLDVEGNIVWDTGFRYPQEDMQPRQDNFHQAWFDSAGNFCVFASFYHGIPVNIADTYFIRINPAGDVIEQRLLKATSNPDATVVTEQCIPVSGGTIVSGQSALTGTGFALLQRIEDDGSIGWTNSWGTSVGFQTFGLDTGDDGYIYIAGDAHTGDFPGDQGVQLARFNLQGEPDWDLFYNTDVSSIFPSNPRLAVGQQGKLWVVGQEWIDEEPSSQTSFPFVWSFQPEDGSPRFARLWECEGHLRPTNSTLFSKLAVNQYGVAVISAEAPSQIGEWREHEIFSTPSPWTYNHPEFTFDSNTPGPLHDTEPAQPEDTLVRDPDPSLHKKHLVILYRP
jgi:hypothetical protein